MSKSAPVVWIPQLPTRYNKKTGEREPIIDIQASKADQYGRVEVLQLGPTNEVAADETVDAIAEQIANHYAPQDYILCIGDVRLLSAAIAAAWIVVGSANLLRWDSRTETYNHVWCKAPEMFSEEFEFCE